MLFFSIFVAADFAFKFYFTTTPCASIFAHHILTYPLTHTILIAETGAVFSIRFHFKLIAAPVADDFFTLPFLMVPALNMPAYCFGLIEDLVTTFFRTLVFLPWHIQFSAQPVAMVW